MNRHLDLSTILFGVLMYASTVQGQFNNILLDDSITVYNPCEPSICINFQNPDNVVGGAILDKVYITLDGGEKWLTQRLESDYGVYGDPCLISDFQGNIYYLHLSNTPSQGGWLDRIVCQHSSDGGVRWTDEGFMGHRNPKDQDKEWAVADPKTGQLYATWTEFDAYSSKKEADHSRILFSTSVDSGKTWSEPINLSEKEGNCLDGDQTTEGAVPTVGPEGEIYVAWSYDEKIYFDKSLDQGQTWLKNDILVADQPGGWEYNMPGIMRCNGLPVTACDISQGPHKGTIYVNWSDQRHGSKDTDIWLSKSTDGGDTWSPPLRVNDDGEGKHQFLTWMTVDPMTGYVYCVFYDRRAYKDNHTDVYLAYSTDGGAHFTNVKISETPFLPNKNVFFGDYTNIAAYDGKIWPIWTRLENKKSSVWTSKILHSELEAIQQQNR
ncbi:MAG: sialidase family protein [Bacteroidota bacterium]